MAIDTTSPRTRRAILLGALGGAAASAAAVIGRTSPVDAHDADDVQYGADNTGATHRTLIALNASSTGNAFVGLTYHGGAGVIGQSADSGVGVYGYYGTGAPPDRGVTSGVFGYSSTAEGVTGESGTGHGLYGSSKAQHGVHATSISSTGVFGVSETGEGVSGTSNSAEGVIGYSALQAGVSGTSNAADQPATVGMSTGNGTGVLGYSGAGPRPTAPAKTGVYGSAHQDSLAVGVRGASSSGRGGMFSGKLAQLRLVPSTAASHPSSGAIGDVFVNTSGRLWFCRGGTVWVQLA